MKDQILKIAKVKSEKEFYKKYPSEEAFMKAHGKAFKKAAMGSKMVNDQLHQLTDFGNPPIAQYGIGMKKKPQNFNNYLQGTNQAGINPDGSIKQVGDAFNNASMAKMSGQQMGSDMSAQFATPSADKLLGKNDINSGAKAGGFDAAGAGMAALGALPAIIGGIEAIGAQKKAKKKAEQATQLSGLSLQAQQTMKPPKNQYVRPEDSLVQPGQLGNPYGTGTNYLQAQDGAMIGGNPTEIQNTYTPGDLYSDLGYEPLEESYKQYRRGGDVPKAEFGEYFQDSGQAQIGSAAGSAIGNMILPGVGGAVGSLVGKVAGNLLGGAKDARELQKQKDKTAMNTSMMGFEQARAQGPLSANLEHGGWISHDWQPQTFTKFGEYSAKDLLKPPHDADMLRAGGSIGDDYYTPPSARALQTYEYGGQMALGGELQIGDGGYAETLSYNPNLPGGEIGMFRGASHDNGGIQTQYGENGVEVEGGEPFTILEDNGSEDGNNLEGGGSKENLVVFGNIKINKEIADLMGDPKAKGKKFKTYIADVAKNDAKQLKTIQKGLDLVEEYDGNSSYDKLGMNSGMANLMGAKAQQKINAEKIKEAGIVQDAIHQTASQLGVKSDKLAEGKLEQETDPSMVAKNGINMETAQFGKSFVDRYNKQNKQKKQTTSVRPKVDNSKVYNPPTFADLTVSPNNPTANVWTGSQNLPSPNIKTGYDESGNYFDESGSLVDQSGASPLTFSADQIAKGRGTFAGRMLRGLGKGFEKYGETALSNIAPFLRPTNANQPLDPDQLTPEYYALATNQLDPVQAQTFQPMLDTPYDISFNDQLNAVDSQSRAAIRAAGSNPAAQAQIMAQALEAKNKVLGEQSRINQTNKMQTYSKNRDLLNDAQLKNLAILDQQYVRQSQAKSNTRTQALEALKSISAKTAQNRLENKQLATYENMYNYRFSPSGRAINVNAPAQFNIPGIGNINASNEQQAKMKDYWEKVVSKDKSGNVTGSKEKTSTSKTGRNGSIVQSLKTL